MVTAADWDVPQTVTVTGVDDAVVDGDQPWAIEVVTATSADPAYDDVALLGTVDVPGVTHDDDGAGYAESCRPAAS